MEDIAVAVWLNNLRNELLALDKEQFHHSDIYEFKRQELKEKLLPLHFRISRDGFGSHCIVPILFPDKGI